MHWNVDLAEVHGQFKAFHWSISEEAETARRDLPARVRDLAERVRPEIQTSLGQLVDAGRRLPAVRRFAGS
jgi:hypothetical protein